ncbi:MAG: sigma-54-dependent Fis family transcriptional regulator [Gemmatimonadaceae bacterium]|nr:sigma-54-dependent Fis family transcriptional regulator [Gemmatimonadaceae bacterium]
MIHASVLVIDDDRTVRETLVEFFAGEGATVAAAGTAAEARTAVSQLLPDIVVMDLRLPDSDGLQLLTELQDSDPDAAVIMLTGHADVRIAVGAMHRGARDVLEKPVDLAMLRDAVQRALETLRLQREVAVLRAHGANEARSESATLRPSFDTLIELAARNDDAPVLILGETGTGKGYIARRIHDRSPRADRPFVEINCASLSATFFESEVFGHERGAFTDARQSKRGLVEVAANGSLFLDEIAELGLEVQPKLLKVIEEQRFRRLGGTAELRSSARVICATNQPMQGLVSERRFRADLFYRLQVLTITIPPLRERPDELPSLVAHFLPRGASLTRDARQALARYAWPGNIRELKNTLWRAAILAEGRPISATALNLPLPTATASPHEILSLAAAEQRAIDAALAATGGNRLRAAALLGIARSTLHEKLRHRARSDDRRLI